MKVSTCCKAIALLLSYVFCAPLVASGITIEVKEPGTLNQLIADVDDASFPELKITGKINAVDIIYLRAQEGRLAHVERLDLSDVTIVEGGGAYAVVKYKGGDVTMDNFVDTYYFSHEYKYESNINQICLVVATTAQLYIQMTCRGCSVKPNIQTSSFPMG